MSWYRPTRAVTWPDEHRQSSSSRVGSGSRAEIGGELAAVAGSRARRAVMPVRTAATTTPDSAIPPQASAAALGTSPARSASHSAGLAPRSASLTLQR